MSHQGLSEKDGRFFFNGLIQGLEYMKQKGIYHRDLKMENLFIDKDFNLKIGDFGFATDKDITKTYRGTKQYMAPEITLQNKEYSPETADVFSCGSVLFTMVMLQFPFQKEATASDQKYQLVINDKFEQYWNPYIRSLKSKGKEVTQDFKELVFQCWRQDPIQRPTYDQILGHGFMQAEITNQEEIIEKFSQKSRLNLPEPEFTEEEKEEQVVTAFEATGAQRGGEDDRKAPLPYVSQFANRFQFESKTSLELLWMTLNLLNQVFDRVELMKVSSEKYEINFEILTENSDLISFNAEIFQKDDHFLLDFTVLNGQKLEFLPEFDKILAYFRPFILDC